MPPIVGMVIGFMCAFTCGIRVTKVIDKGKTGRIVAWAGGAIVFIAIEIFHFVKLTS